MQRLVPTLLVALGGASTLAALDAPAPAPAPGDAEEHGLRWGAYGELHYNNFSGAKTDAIDLHRFVLLSEYRFDERTHLVAEIEIEHALAGDGAPGEVEIEQAYLGFEVAPEHTIQAGVILVPSSRLNLEHEPDRFHGVERPYVQKVIIPTTWWEAGVGAHGQITDDLEYHALLSSTLDSDGFSASGIRGGRQKAAKAKAGGFMLTGRVDWNPQPGLAVGSSLIVGETGQDEDDPGALLTMIEADAIYEWNQVEVSGTVAYGSIADADELSAGVPENFWGGYLTVAYDLFHHWAGAPADQRLQAFGRVELWDTQASLPDGVAEDESKIGSILQLGVTWTVRPGVVFKADYQDWDNDADSAVDQFNLGVGFSF